VPAPFGRGEGQRGSLRPAHGGHAREQRRSGRAVQPAAPPRALTPGAAARAAPFPAMPALWEAGPSAVPGDAGTASWDAWGDAPGHAGRITEVTLARTEGQLFRERMGFLILCVIGAYCTMRILVELKSILEPFLWALFLVMAWKPVVDKLESRIERLLAASCAVLRADHAARAGSRSPKRAEGGADPNEELQSMLEDQDPEPSAFGNEVHPEGALELTRSGRSSQEHAERGTCRDVDGEDADRWEDGRSALRHTLARSLAVLTATAVMLGLLCVFGMLIQKSARNMRENWDVYQKGAEKLTREIKGFFQKVPESYLKQYQDVSTNMVNTAQDFLYGLLGDFVNNVSSLLLGGSLTLLYTLFMLCCPVPMDSSIDDMFRKYVWFKTLACFSYGICVGVLLSLLSIDLAAVFALMTFVLNYVPEVGPFMAMVLPSPVIILDSRLERPFLVLLTAVIGQLALKFAFSNIIEVKLIESDKKLRMHPVMILLSVGIFGYLWGPTGMLLSVPLMALMKISLFSELVPASYRDPILVVLEGDRNAPQTHGLRRPRAPGPSSVPPGG